MSHSPFVIGALLDAVPEIAHGFCGRTDQNGIDLNVSEKFATSPDAAHQARMLAVELVFGAPRALARVTQVHSNLVHTIIETQDIAQMPKADALVTNRRDVALGIVTADCAPVLFADPEAQIIGAAHAGWRGATSGVLAATVAAMQKIGAQPSRIVATIGPTISGPNYEVGDAFKAEVTRLNAGTETFFFRPEPDASTHFDLPRFIHAELARLGLSQIEDVGLCTYAKTKDFYSHRRATHTGEAQGRQIALIGLNPESTP